MRNLIETTLSEYETSRDLCVDPIDIEDSTHVLFMARFMVDTGCMAVEGLVSAQRVDDDHIDFNHVDGDGQAVGVPYLARIDCHGIIAGLVLTDGEAMRTSEGYLRRYRDEMDDEFADELARLERELVPVHFTMGGAAGDLAKRELRIDH